MKRFRALSALLAAMIAIACLSGCDSGTDNNAGGQGSGTESVSASVPDPVNSTGSAADGGSESLNGSVPDSPDNGPSEEDRLAADLVEAIRASAEALSSDFDAHEGLITGDISDKARFDGEYLDSPSAIALLIGDLANHARVVGAKVLDDGLYAVDFADWEGFEDADRGYTYDASARLVGYLQDGGLFVFDMDLSYIEWTNLDPSAGGDGDII